MALMCFPSRDLDIQTQMNRLFDNGALTVNLPKTEDVKPKEIKIDAV